MAKTANEELLDALVRHQVYLLRYSGYIRNRIHATLDKTEEALAAAILTRIQGKGALATPEDYDRLERIMLAIQKSRSPAWQGVYAAMSEDLSNLSQEEASRMASYVSTAAPVVLQLSIPAPDRLKAIALSQPFHGRVLKDWAATMEATDLAAIRAALQQGMVTGMSSQAITRLVIGTAEMQGADGVTEMTRRQVTAVTRTAVAHVAAYSRDEFVRENEELFDEELFVATLDSRTTPVCRANDGKHFPLDSGPRPPLHYQCRSLRVPIIGAGPMSDRPAKPVTEKMLLREYAEKNGLDPVPTRRKDLPRGTKGDYDAFSRRRVREMTGRVPAQTSYNDWLKGQSKEFQDDVLGKIKALLFRKGDLSLDKFVDRAGQELTLPELARKEAAAFRAAGLNPEKFL